MSLELPYGIKRNTEGSLDHYYGPYDSLAAANAAVPTSIRKGRTVKIGNEEYWWTEGTGDQDLILKEFAWKKSGTTDLNNDVKIHSLYNLEFGSFGHIFPYFGVIAAEFGLFQGQGYGMLFKPGGIQLTADLSNTAGDLYQRGPDEDGFSYLKRIASVATGSVLISGGVDALNTWGKVTSAHVDSTVAKTTDLSAKADQSYVTILEARIASLEALVAYLLTPDAPVLSGVPTISGTASVGNTLTATPASASGTGVITTWQWERDGVEISGATSDTYILTTDDYGVNITVVQTASNASGTDSAESAATAITALAVPVIDSVPTISGTATVPNVLTATPSSVTGDLVTTTWQWERNGTPISGATNSTYTLTTDDYGVNITVVQTATNTAGSDTAESTQTAIAAEPTETVTSISFTNPSPLHKVWRSGIERTGTITPPTGYTVSAWAIKNHKTQADVATGSGTSVTHTFTFVSMENCNTYDLLVTVTNGSDSYSKMFPGEFTCLPQVPSSYDITWNTSGDKGMGWTNRAGTKILATGTFTSRLNPYWLKSDDPTNPVHVVLKDLLITTANTGCFHLTAMKNVIFDGCTEEDVQYGCILRRSGAGTSQQFQLLGAEPNDNTKTSENVYVCGIEADGGYINNSTGNTAFRILNNRDAANHELTFSFDNLVMFNLYGHDSWEEVYYLGQSDDTLSSGRGYPYYTNSMYYRLRGEDGGNEVFQFGLNRDFEVFCCDFRRGGLRNQSLHENLVQWSNGNVNGAFYMNYLEQESHNLLSFFTGRTGGDNEFFSNIMYSTGKDSDGAGNVWGRVDLHDSDPSLKYTFRHNTIIVSNGYGFTLYEAYATDWDKFNSTANIVVASNTSDYENGSGVDPTHVVFDNYKLLVANIANAMFVDSDNLDFNLASLSSPAFDTWTATTMDSPFADYDYEGYAYEDDVAGADSGVELMF